MSIRAKIILLSTLVGIALVASAFAAVTTCRAYGSLHHDALLVQAGDVATIRSWMTLHYIVRIYHVPQDYLYQRLGLRNMPSLRHATLDNLAGREHQPVQQVISSVQRAVVSYRQQHAPSLSTRLRYTSAGNLLGAPPVVGGGVHFRPQSEGWRR